MQTQPKFEYNLNSAMLGNRAMLGDITVRMEFRPFIDDRKYLWEEILLLGIYKID